MLTLDERRTLQVTAAFLLLASLVRWGWEGRDRHPLLPPSPVPEALLEETRAALERAERSRTPLAEGERVDPNRDPEWELARLPGVGPALAERIVTTRSSLGAFQEPEDLLRVSGIGSATLDRIRPYLDLSDPPSRPSVPGARPTGGGVVPGVVTGGGPGGGVVRTTELGSLVDLNRAGAAELETLPGIGPALAGRILAERSRRGRFDRVEELLEVSGIGPATLERIRPLLRVGP